MKKAFLILALFTGISVYAQRFEGSYILALNAAQIDGDDLFGYNKPGIYAGFSTALPISKHLSFAGVLAYSGKGAVKRPSEEINPSTNSYHRFSIHSLEAPITARYRHKKWMGEMGVGFGFLIAANVDDGIGVYSYRDRLKPVEVFYLVSAGYEINNRLTGFGRWSYSLISIAEGDNSHVFQIPLRGLYNNWLTFGIMGRIGRK